LNCLWCGKELPKRRRKYCSDECSHEYFIHNIAPLWWNVAKERAIKRANHLCEKCGKWGYLEVHHKEKLGKYEARHNSPKNRQDNLIVLCRKCHEEAHHPNSDTVRRDKIKKIQLTLRGIG
jgi:ribosomal protein S27AE